MNETPSKEDLNYLKAKYFYDNKIPIHVNLSKGNSRYWYNGTIKELSPSFFLLDEKEDGQIPVFFIEVFDIKPLGKPKEEENDGAKEI